MLSRYHRYCLKKKNVYYICGVPSEPYLLKLWYSWFIIYLHNNQVLIKLNIWINSAASGTTFVTCNCTFSIELKLQRYKNWLCWIGEILTVFPGVGKYIWLLFV